MGIFSAVTQKFVKDQDTATLNLAKADAATKVSTHAALTDVHGIIHSTTPPTGTTLAEYTQIGPGLYLHSDGIRMWVKKADIAQVPTIPVPVEPVQGNQLDLGYQAYRAEFLQIVNGKLAPTQAVTSSFISDAMVMAVLARDQTTFDALYAWADSNLKRGKAGSGQTTFLEGWASAASTAGVVNSYTLHSGAEVRAAKALWQAKQLWNNVAYRDAANKKAALIKSLANTDEGRAFLGSDETQKAATNGHHIFSSSHWTKIRLRDHDIVAFRVLKTFTGDPIFDQLIAGTYDLWNKVTVSPLSTTAAGIPAGVFAYSTSTHSVSAIVSGTNGWTETQSTDFTTDAQQALLNLVADWNTFQTTQARDLLLGGVKNFYLSHWSSESKITISYTHAGVKNSDTVQATNYSIAAQIAGLSNPADSVAVALKAKVPADMGSNTYGRFIPDQVSPGPYTSSINSSAWMAKAHETGRIVDLATFGTAPNDGSTGTPTTPTVPTSPYSADFVYNASKSDDFTGGFNDALWSKYGPYAGTSQHGYWDPANVSVSGGNLVLHCQGGSTSGDFKTGTVNSDYAFTYGAVEVRSLMPVNSAGFGPAWILWPVSDVWEDGELDFYEDTSNAKNHSSITFHGKDNGNNNAPQTEVSLTPGVFHVHRIEWTPTRVTTYLDGVKTYELLATDQFDWYNQSTGQMVHQPGTNYIPTVPHHLVIQMDSQQDGWPAWSGNNIDVLIDYVKIYDYVPSTSTPTTPVVVPDPVVPIAGAVKLGVQLTSSVRNYYNSLPAGTKKDRYAYLALKPMAYWSGLGWDNEATGWGTYLNSLAADEWGQGLMYSIPGRDYSGGFSSGGAATADAYKVWVTKFLDKIGTKKCIIIYEPDSLPDLNALSTTARSGRVSVMTWGIAEIKRRCPQVKLYIDAGHSAWVPADDMASRLKEIHAEVADGAAINTSNTQPFMNCVTYGQAICAKMGPNFNFIIDTGRNGNDVQTYEWCNPPQRQIGRTPLFGSPSVTGVSRLDGYLFAKTPGESDGPCNGGPNAGVFFPEYLYRDGVADNSATAGLLQRAPVIQGSSTN